MSIAPAPTPDPNIILASYTELDTIPAINSLAGAAKNLNASTIASGSELPPLEIGMMPKEWGTIPVASGVVIPEISDLSVPETENNQVLESVQDTKFEPVQELPATTKVELGTQPKNAGKPTQ